MTHRFHIVDVFADRPYTGNPLAVVLGADDLAAETMQQIAAEMNYSETTFVRSDAESDGGWHVRMFTPAHEIPFAGHPILGTAWVIQHYLAASAATSLLLRVGVGPVPVSFEPADDGTPAAWFVAPPISIGRTCDAEPIAAALGISPSDIDQTAPILELSAGISATLVPLRSRDALRRSRLDLAAFSPLARLGFAPLVYVFCRETRDPRNQMSARFFFDAHGVREDPATGNAAALLGAYLREHRSLAPRSLSLSLRIEQGHEMGRPSLVLVQARASEIRVGGGVVPVARGELVASSNDAR